MEKIKAAVYGYGNVGRAAVESLRRAPDFEIVGVVRRDASMEAGGFRAVSDISELGKIDAALLCHPTRGVPALAAELAGKGIHTVDSFDIHDSIWDYLSGQDSVNKASGTVSIISAGWDPGTDSVFRAVFEAMAPRGTTRTNFGPGMSMGHSVAARAAKGVKNAISFTIPEGGGVHSRKVYIEVEDGFRFEDAAAAIKSDPYFASDKTEVEQVPDVNDLRKTTHGVLLERTGESGALAGQKFSFDMRIDNPALTAQVMVGCARAAMKLPPGCYTLPEVPPMWLLPGTREELVRRLV